jgi:hypothetical protein
MINLISLESQQQLKKYSNNFDAFKVVWLICGNFDGASVNFGNKSGVFKNVKDEVIGLTKPGEVGEILVLYRLKSLSLDYKAKLKSPCFFLQVTLFLQIIFVLWSS